MSSRSSRGLVRRLWRLVVLLRTHRYGLSPTRLQQELGVSRATFYRDLITLEEVGVPLLREPRAGKANVALDQGSLPVLRPTGAQHAALLIARHMLRGLDGSEVLAELDALLDERQATSKAGDHIMAMPTRGPVCHAAITQAVDAALRGGRHLRIFYRGAKDAEPRWRLVEPCKLIIAQGDLYLYAWDRDEEDWRTFKLMRMHLAEPQDEPNTTREPPNLAGAFEHAVHVWSGDVQSVAVRLSDEVAWLLPEYPLNATQTVEQQDGYVVVRAKTNGLIETMRWVLGWGSAAKALEPPELREAVATQLTRAVRQYGVATALPVVSTKVRRPYATVADEEAATRLNQRRHGHK